MDDVPIDTLRGLAKTLGETVPHDASTVSDVMATAPSAVFVSNVLSCVLASQKKRLPRFKSMQHKLRYARGEKTIELIVFNLRVFDEQDIAALKLLSPRVLQVFFHFVNPESLDPLACGMMSLRLLHSSSDLSDPAPRVFAELTRRRQRTHDVDWSTSTVVPIDRDLVLRVIDDVYNMYEIMPPDVTVSLEPIKEVDYSVHAKRAVLKRKDQHVDDTSLASVQNSGAQLGYCLHFCGVPSFGDEFFAHMANKYGPRWLGATLLFPSVTKHASIIYPQRLAISISAASSIVQSSKAFASVGAKRLCGKVYIDQDNE
jgi:hypothetical protein